MRLRARALAVAVAVAVVAAWGFAARAQASSIFFIRGNDIWVANPDGSGQRQVTSDGGSPLPGDTGADPYHAVAAGKQGAAPKVAFERGTNHFGSIGPDGSGDALNPGDATMGRTVITNSVSLDLAGDEMAYEQGSWHGTFPYAYTTARRTPWVWTPATRRRSPAPAGSSAPT